MYKSPGLKVAWTLFPYIYYLFFCVGRRELVFKFHRFFNENFSILLIVFLSYFRTQHDNQQIFSKKGMLFCTDSGARLSNHQKSWSKEIILSSSRMVAVLKFLSVVLKKYLDISAGSIFAIRTMLPSTASLISPSFATVMRVIVCSIICYWLLNSKRVYEA